MRRRPVAAFLVAGALVASCGSADARVVVSEARIGQPTGPNAAMYFTAKGGSEPDRLVGAFSDAAASMELHETTTGEGGVMGMRAVEGLDLPGDGVLVLEPAGVHLMLVDARRMEVGETVDVTLVWERAGEMIVTAQVVEPGNTMGHGS